MCGKFTALASWSEVVAFSQPLTESGGDEGPSGDEGSNDEIVTYRVGGLLPVIVWDAETRSRRVVKMRWGFPDPRDWRRPRPIHARSETIDVKEPFRTWHFRPIRARGPAKCSNCSSVAGVGRPEMGVYAANSRETWAGAHVDRPAGVRTPRASNSWAMAASVVLPARWISAIGARVVASVLVARPWLHRRLPARLGDGRDCS
jgi:hypothetical protein